MVLRGILISAIITGIIGVLIVVFRERLVAGASQLGSTVGSIFTAPFTGFLGTISTAFTDLPDIQIDLPGLIIGGGGVTILGTDVAEVPEIVTGGLEDIFEPVFDFFAPKFGGLFGGQGQLGVTGVGALTRPEILEQFPGTIGLFDVLATKEIEFLPFGIAGVQSAEEFGLGLKLTGQIFQDIGSVEDVLALA